MYEGSHECTKCSNPASVHFGCVYMTTNVWQGIKLSSVMGNSMPLPPISVGPKSSFLPKFWWRGCRISSNHQPTNGIYLVVKGLAVSMVRVTGLTTPQPGHLGSNRDGLSFHLLPPQVSASCLIGMGSWDPRWEVTEISHPAGLGGERREAEVGAPGLFLPCGNACLV